jgi:hypothetical protein
MTELTLSFGATVGWCAIAAIEWSSGSRPAVAARAAGEYRVFALLAVCLAASYAVIWSSRLVG